MFLCAKCLQKNCTLHALAFDWNISQGPCELCGKVHLCSDVPSSINWAWRLARVKVGKHTPKVRRKIHKQILRRKVE
jgi:hypothetical protein